MAKTEFERKFLAPDVPNWILEKPYQQIYKTYVGKTETDELRVRKIITESEIVYMMTHKLGHVDRPETEFPISEGIYQQQLTCRNLIPLIKKRYFFLSDEYRATLDIYEDGFDSVFEVEFDTEAQKLAYEPEPWFGNEVTGDKQYSNYKLWERLQVVAEKTPEIVSRLQSEFANTQWQIRSFDGGMAGFCYSLCAELPDKNGNPIFVDIGYLNYFPRCEVYVTPDTHHQLLSKEQYDNLAESPSLQSLLLFGYRYNGVTYVANELIQLADYFDEYQANQILLAFQKVLQFFSEYQN